MILQALKRTIRSQSKLGHRPRETMLATTNILLISLRLLCAPAYRQAGPRLCGEFGSELSHS